MLIWIGNVFLALFAIDAGLSVLDEALKLSGFEGIASLRDAVAYAVIVAVAPMYFLVAVSPRLPARVFLPPLLAAVWFVLGAAPLQLAVDDPATYGLTLSLVQLGVSALAYGAVFAGSGWRTPLLDSSAAPGPEFAPLRFAGFAGGTLLLGPPLLAAYLALAATTWVEVLSAGFVEVDLEGVHLAERHYRNGDREIRLVGMIHVGSEEVYDRVFDSFALESTVVLEEGVTDESGLLESKLSYGKLAERLDLVTQEPISDHYGEAAAVWPHLRHPDMDVSEFSNETLEFIERASTIAAAIDDPQELLRLLQDPSALPEAGESVLNDILTRRNERLLEAIDAAVPEYERVIVPWGALHMPWIEEQIESRGFEKTDSTRHRFIEWARIGSLAEQKPIQ